MTRFLRPNGSALLTLVVALLLATWPLFGTYTIGVLIAGFFLSLAMQAWPRQHPSTLCVPERTLHSEINLASIPVRGDGAGALFVAGSVVILLALPQLRWFLVASMASAVVMAAALIAWRHHASARC